MIKKRFISLLICLVYATTIALSLIGCTTKDIKEQKNNEIEASEEVKVKVENNVKKDNIDKTKETNSNNENIEKEAESEEKEHVVAFKDEKNRTVIEVPYEKLEFEAKVQPYSVNPDLSNIENLDQFGSFTDKQKELLSKNGFVAVFVK